MVGSIAIGHPQTNVSLTQWVLRFEYWAGRHKPCSREWKLFKVANVTEGFGEGRKILTNETGVRTFLPLPSGAPFLPHNRQAPSFCEASLVPKVYKVPWSVFHQELTVYEILDVPWYGQSVSSLKMTIWSFLSILSRSRLVSVLLWLHHNTKYKTFISLYTDFSIFGQIT